MSWWSPRSARPERWPGRLAGISGKDGGIVAGIDEPTDTLPSDPTPAESVAQGSRSAGRRRVHPLVVGTVAAVAALSAALVAGAVLSAGTENPDPLTPELALRFSDGDQDPTTPPVGDVAGDALPAENFSMLGGGLGSFADYGGRPLVVNLFSSNCPPCVKEMPDFERVHQEFGDEVAFLGINIQDQPSAALALVERTGVTYDIARDPSGDLARQLGMVVMPTTFFVSSQGQVVDAKAGALDADELRTRIEALRG